MEMNLDGITVKLEIRGYTKYDRESEEEPRWCRLDFSFISQPWLRYKRQDDEVLTNEEVEALAEHLECLLNGRMAEPTELECIEPDFCFQFEPEEDVRQNPRVLYVKPGNEWADILMRWQVYFWHDGLTDNHLSVTLDRADMEKLYAYLQTVISAGA